MAGPIKMVRTWNLKPWMNDMEGGRRLFTVGAVVDGELIAQGRAYNKKDASQIAAQVAIDKLGLNKTETEEDQLK